MDLNELIEDYNTNKLRTIVFDEKNPNWSGSGSEYNLLFIRAQERYLNNLLAARGHVFLNEIHDMLGVPRTQHGALTGWVLFGQSERPIRFGVSFSQHILIDVAVDGVIFDKI